MGVSQSVVLFYSTSAAIRTEKLTQHAGLKVKFIPVPPHLSSDCGICLLFESEDVDKIGDILNRGDVEYDSIHKV